MSDLMLLGVLQMPIEMVMSSELSTIQYIHRGHEAAARIKSDAALIEQQAARIADLESQIAGPHTCMECDHVFKTGESIGAIAKDAEPIWCQACGDGITAHDPGICGTCFAMKYRDAAVAKDAERYRWLRRQAIAVKNYASGYPNWEIDWSLRGESFEVAIDAAIAASAEKSGE